MKIWISKNSEVTVHEQLVTQIKMGIASRDLTPAEKLPSTRELARRFGIHQNTVSAAYRELAAEGLVHLRKGSGVYISDGPQTDDHNIGDLLEKFVSDAGALGFSPDKIRVEIRNWLAAQPTAEVLVVETDPELRSILVEEIHSRLSCPVRGISNAELDPGSVGQNAAIASLFNDKDRLKASLPAGAPLIHLEVNSVPQTMIGERRPGRSELVAVVSAWDRFIDLAKVYLLAASIDPESLIIRTPNDDNWSSGLDFASIIICDSYSARYLKGDPRVRVFRLIADSSIEELRHTIF